MWRTQNALPESTEEMECFKGGRKFLNLELNMKSLVVYLKLKRAGSFIDVEGSRPQNLNTENMSTEQVGF
jgi:hypothetical protein